MGAFIPVIAPIFKKILIQFIVSAITSKIFGKKSAKGRGAGAQSSSQIMVNKSSNNDPIPVVYGRQRLGGVRAFVGTSDGAGDQTKNNVLNLIIVLSEGVSNGPYRVLFGEDTVWWNLTGTDTRSGETNSDVNGQSSSLASGGLQLTNFRESNKYNISYMAFYNGTTTQTVDTTMQTSIGSGTWDNNRRLQGLSYIALKLPFNEAYNGAAPEVFVETNGKLIRQLAAPASFNSPDLVQGNEYTITSLGTTDWALADASNFRTHRTYKVGTKFIANSGRAGTGTALQTVPGPGSLGGGNIDQSAPAVLADYLTNTTYGKGIPDSDIDWNSFGLAEAYFQSVSPKKFAINGFLDTGSKLFDNIEEILAACNSMLVFSKGKYKMVHREQNESSVFSFTEDNIIGAIDISLPPKSAKFNKIEYVFPNVKEQFQDDIKIVNNSTYLTEDNSVVLLGRNETTLVTDETIVNNLATWMMNNSRHQETISFTAAHTAIDVEAGQVIDVTHPVVGYNAKKFRVQEIIVTEDDTLKITAQEYTSSIQI